MHGPAVNPLCQARSKLIQDGGDEADVCSLRKSRLFRDGCHAVDTFVLVKLLFHSSRFEGLDP